MWYLKACKKLGISSRQWTETIVDNYLTIWDMNSELLFYSAYHIVKSISLSVHTQKWYAINGISKSDGKIRSADMMRLDLWNTSNILWSILLPSMRDGQSKISLNCYWSEIPVSLCMYECMHTHGMHSYLL